MFCSKKPALCHKEPYILVKLWLLLQPCSQSKEPWILSKRALYSVKKSPAFYPKNPEFCPKEPYILSQRALYSVNIMTQHTLQHPIFCQHYDYSVNIMMILSQRALYSITKSPIFYHKEPYILTTLWRLLKHHRKCQVLVFYVKSPRFYHKEPYILSQRALYSITKSPIFWQHYDDS